MALVEQYCAVVRTIRAFDPASIVWFGICSLRLSTGNPTPSMDEAIQNYRESVKPWTVMLLIRWTLEHQLDRPSTLPVTPAQFDRLCDDIEQLYDTDEISGSFSGLSSPQILLRLLSQQTLYWSRWEEVQTSTARQQMWYYDMDADGSIRKLFEKSTGASVRNFLELYYWCYHDVSEGRFQFQADTFSQRLENESGRPSIASFLKTLSLRPADARRFLRRHTKEHTGKNSRLADVITFQIFEPSPLQRYPFHMIGDWHIPYSPGMLVHSMQHNVYRILKGHMRGNIGDLFGDVFEQYVGKDLRCCTAGVKDEAWIEKQGLQKKKHADFFVEVGNSAVFVDAKCTELPLIPKVLQSKDSIIRNTKANLIKGMQQIVSTSSHFLSKKIIGPECDLCGLVVTYGHYPLTWETYCELAQDEILNCLTKVGEMEIIERIRFLFVDIESFDFLVAVVRKHNLRLDYVLSYIVEENRWPRSASLYIKHHLDKRWQYCFPPHVGEVLPQIACFVPG